MLNRCIVFFIIITSLLLPQTNTPNDKINFGFGLSFLDQFEHGNSVYDDMKYLYLSLNILNLIKIEPGFSILYIFGDTIYYKFDIGIFYL